MDVSIVIVNWNTSESLRNCLRSIYAQTCYVNYEVCVIDNASTDGSVEMVRGEFPTVTVIANTKNRGFAAANNQGIEIAEGRYILLLNSDTTICNNAIEKCVKYADKHQDVAIVGPQVWEDESTIQYTCFGYPSLTNYLFRLSGLVKLFKNNHIFGREQMRWWKRDSEREVDVVSGMFMLVRREAIEQCGALDKTYFVYCEEADWCYRFSKAGWKIMFWPGAKIIHAHGGSHSTKQNSLAMFVQQLKSILIFLRKHRGVASYYATRVLLALSYLVRSVALATRAVIVGLFKKDASQQKKRLAELIAGFKYCAFNIQP